MRGEVELLKQKQEDKFSTSLKKAYSDTYYTTNKHIADSVDYAVNFATVSYTHLVERRYIKTGKE